ncbi:glycoside hydrolase family 3 C-terminal domain-containing protein [Streptomyces sp. NPDC057474]|uniref:glycoside hydrolase family 3 C-terminal domain-containing protein n=1 Tax=Streptomyces sp. NPDC057474 TaxID=3346144 RepID=UPI0036C2C1A3
MGRPGPPPLLAAARDPRRSARRPRRLPRRPRRRCRRRGRARDADLVVVIAEEWREGLDAQDLTLPDGQESLIEAVADANPCTVVVVQSGGALRIPWTAKIQAVIAAFYQ